MSINNSGMTGKVSQTNISIPIEVTEPLLKLANLLDWKMLENIVFQDLKKTEKGAWWLGRPLMLRIHLGAYILQSIFNKRDRELERDLKFNALFQAFCGCQLVSRWHVPDHTKIETFRNRLSSSTHHTVSEIVLKTAFQAGFLNPAWMDVDSTVQEANMSYPSDATLMTRLAQKAEKVSEILKKCSKFIPVNIKKVKGILKEYLFLPKKTLKEKKQEVFKKLHHVVVEEVAPVIMEAMKLTEEKFQTLSSKTKTLIDQVCEMGSGLLLDIEKFIETEVMVPTKILSFHLKQVACINKGKVGKPYEFGRVFQLGRLGGNFLLIKKSKTIRESDKSAIGGMVYQHRKVFGKGALKSIGTDKAYSSQQNMRAAKQAQIIEIAIQHPKNTKCYTKELSEKVEIQLQARRAGIEPLIGHVKEGGLRKSRMKTDQGIESSAYRSVTGFNLRQLIRHLEGERIRAW